MHPIEIAVIVANVALVAMLLIGLLNGNWSRPLERSHCLYCWRSFARYDTLKMHERFDHPNPLRDEEHGVVGPVVPLSARSTASETEEVVVVRSNGRDYRVLSGGKK